MRLEIPYCTEEEAVPLKWQIYADVLEHFNSYDLDQAWRAILQFQGMNAFRMVFDPFDAKGDPIFLFQQMLLPNGLQYKVDWIKNDIESILKSVHLIDSTKSFKLEVRNSLLVRIGYMDKSIKRNKLENTLIQTLLNEYYNVILSEDFTVKKLDITQIVAYCERIKVEMYNDWVEIGNPGSGRLNPILKERLVFMLNVNVKQDNVIYTFEWKSTNQKLKDLYSYLLQNGIIAPTTEFDNFSKVFQRIPLLQVSEHIVWIDTGGKNPNQFNTGLIVELVYHLGRLNFIDEKYMNPRERGPVIESCIRLGNGVVPKLNNKRISSPQGRTMKVQQLVDYLEHL